MCYHSRNTGWVTVFTGRFPPFFSNKDILDRSFRLLSFSTGFKHSTFRQTGEPLTHSTLEKKNMSEWHIENKLKKTSPGKSAPQLWVADANSGQKIQFTLSSSTPPHRLKHSSLTITLKHFLRGISAGHLDWDFSGAGERGKELEAPACSACEKQNFFSWSKFYCHLHSRQQAGWMKCTEHRMWIKYSTFFHFFLECFNKSAYCKLSKIAA